MAPIKKRGSSESLKLLYIGDSGAGKTGSLASLAAAGYKLRIIDLDNGLDVLDHLLKDPKSKYVQQNPDIADNVSTVTFTDPMKNVGGRLVPKKVSVWQNTMKMLMDWKDEDEDLGKVAEWGPDTVLVIDSLSFLSQAALNYHLMMNGYLGKARTQNEWRRDIGAAQQLLRDFLNTIFDSSIHCHVILTSHITMVTEMGDNPTALAEGERKSTIINGYPSAIGRALSPQIPRYFNSVLIARTVGYGQSAKHHIYTTTQNVGGQLINAKNPAMFSVKDSYPIETGLADYFVAVRGADNVQGATKQD